jgi:UDP-GlcNAc:undecaprenyl-phosphate/decaprenyl-phosphate GlcNAc-1-phosphate transferase
VSESARVALAFGLPALLTFLTVPLAIAAARRTGFLDSPRDYKAHLEPTPYLGGAAVLVAALPVSLLLDGQVADRYGPLLAATVFVALVGAVDDRLNLSPWLRLGLEALAAWFLWSKGLGWSFLGSDVLDLLLTIFWVTALVNAFNLMDNLDGAATTVASVSSAAVAVLALIGDDLPLALIAAALCGALVGFLRFNLAGPARIFLGDGGSMPIGLLVGASLMSVPTGNLAGWGAVAVATMIVGLPVFDTTLVIISRRRRGVPVLSGATDHTTHRLLAVLKTPPAVAAALAVVQTCLCALAIEATRLGDAALIALAFVELLLAVATIAIIESPGWMPVSDDS